MEAKTSPKTWQQPTSRIKLKVKKRRPSKSLCQVDNHDKSSAINQQDGVVSSSVKRSNPFSCTTTAKRRPSSSTNSCDHKLFQALDGHIDDIVYPNDVQYAKSTEIVSEKARPVPKEEQYNSYEENNEITQQQQQQQQPHHVYPIDWSLKTKARFTSSASFNWTGSLKSVEIAESISGFVRCDGDGGSRAMVHSACNVWVHPSIPSLQLFPRQATNKKYDKDMVNGLQKDWVSSFHSLFNLLRCGHCGYFYVCASHCTMLFMSDSNGMTAVITPTTKGFRDALHREGIEYSLPHDTAQDTTSDDDGDGDHDKENNSDDDNDEWMESIGLDKEQFPSLEKHTKQQTIQIRTKDQHPSSTVMVTGSDTMALSNFILNWKTFTTGIPPTLLAPVAFEGATLRSHKITQGMVKHRQDQNMKQVYSLEVSGAILPGCLQRICHAIKTLHNGPFTVTLTPYQCTAPFNVSDRVCDVTTLPKAGMTASELDYFTAANQQIDKTCIKEIKFDDVGLCTWK